MNAHKRMSLLRKLGINSHLRPIFFDKDKALNSHPFLKLLKNNGSFNFVITCIIPLRMRFICVQYPHKTAIIPFHTNGEMCTKEELDAIKELVSSNPYYYTEALSICCIWNLLQRLSPKEVLNIMMDTNMSRLGVNGDKVESF